MVDRPNEQYKNQSPERKQALLERCRSWRAANPAQTFLTRIKNKCRIFNIPFNLTLEDFEIPDVCPVLGIELKKGGGKLQGNSPSIDRIIPSLGYVKGNVIIISHKANMIKSNATPDEIQKVGEFFKKLLKEQSEIAQAA